MSRYARHNPDDEAGPLPFVTVPALPPRCLCSHPESMHYRDRKGRPTCGSAACGCVSFRPTPETPAIPARFDERYDPSPEPIDRSIQ